MRLLPAVIVVDAVIPIWHGQLRLSRDAVVAQRDVEERGDLRAGALLLRRQRDGHWMRCAAIALVVAVAGVGQQAARLLAVVLRMSEEGRRFHFVGLNLCVKGKDVRASITLVL